MPWTPLVEPDSALAASATAAVRDIALALAETPHPTASSCDRAVFWAYVAGVFDEPFANAAYTAAVDDLVAELRAGSPHHALYGGLAGVGWSLAHVLDGQADDALGVIDAALGRLLATDPWPGPIDLTTGLVGMGVYFLERLGSSPSPAARDGLARVVRHLDRGATRSDHGTTWWTSPATLPHFVACEYPDGYFDCGVAHGVPGTIAMLGRAATCLAVPADTRALARSLCEDAIRWVAAQRQPAHPNGRFPARITRDDNSRGRTAWCYGDPGVAVALWSAASRLSLATDLAHETATDCAARAVETTGVRDAPLCHGAAGLAHLLNRCYQASGDATIAAAARTWLERTLAMRGRDGIGGFVAWRGDDGDQPNASLLEGSIGIGLALLAAVTEHEPSWDRLLLCDVPTIGSWGD
jgi:hypothetical protein